MVLVLPRLSLRDISDAFEAGYPSDLSYKLLERKSKCLLEMGERESAKATVDECIKSLKNAKLDDSKKEAINKSLNEFISSSTSEKSQSSNSSNNSESMPIIVRPNHKFPAFSDAVEIKYGEDQGRYGIASRDIKIGKKI